MTGPSAVRARRPSISAFRRQRAHREIPPARARRRTDRGRPKPDISSAADASPNIFFLKIETCIIMVPMDAIEIGNARTAAGAVGEPRPRALCRGRARVKPGDPRPSRRSLPGARSGEGLFAGIWDNALESLESRKKVDLDFLAPDLDFLAPGLDFLAPGLEFLAAGLEILASGHEGRPRRALLVPAGGGVEQKGTVFGA